MTTTKPKALIKIPITTYYEGRAIASISEVWCDVLQQLPCGYVEIRLPLAHSSRLVLSEDVVRVES